VGVLRILSGRQCQALEDERLLTPVATLKAWQGSLWMHLATWRREERVVECLEDHTTAAMGGAELLPWCVMRCVVPEVTEETEGAQCTLYGDMLCFRFVVQAFCKTGLGHP